MLVFLSLLNTSFPWIGLAGATLLLGLLFATRCLQTDRRISRWWDRSWLAWAGVLAYLVHNVEEYGIDMHGHAYAFPRALCAMLGFDALYPVCPLPPTIFTAVNVPMFWLAAPIGAGLSKRHPVAGLSIYAVIVINAAAHITESLMHGGAYNPGCMTAVLMFLPLSAWMIHTQFVRGPLAYPVLLFLLIWGAVAHLLLMAAMLVLAKGVLHAGSPSILVQIANAALLIVAALRFERWAGPAIWRRAAELPV